MVARNSGGTTFGADDTFKTIQDPPPPPPVLGQSADLKPVSGIVLIKPPAGQSLGLAADARTAAALSIGQGFVPLTEARRIPTGSQVDARRGTLGVATATGTGKGKTQQLTLRGGVFRFTQSRSGNSKGLTTLSLLDNSTRASAVGATPPGDATAPRPSAGRTGTRSSGAPVPRRWSTSASSPCSTSSGTAP
jgi:hypothetical protein